MRPTLPELTAGVVRHAAHYRNALAQVIAAPDCMSYAPPHCNARTLAVFRNPNEHTPP